MVCTPCCKSIFNIHFPNSGNPHPQSMNCRQNQPEVCERYPSSGFMQRNGETFDCEVPADWLGVRMELKLVGGLLTGDEILSDFIPKHVTDNIQHLCQSLQSSGIPWDTVYCSLSRKVEQLAEVLPHCIHKWNPQRNTWKQKDAHQKMKCMSTDWFREGWGSLGGTWGWRWMVVGCGWLGVMLAISKCNCELGPGSQVSFTPRRKHLRRHTHPKASKYEGRADTDQWYYPLLVGRYSMNWQYGSRDWCGGLSVAPTAREGFVHP